MANAIILIFLFIMLILGASIYKLYHQLIVNKVHLARMRAILNHTTEAWYAWQIDRGYISCSPHFPKLFDMSESTPARSIDILAHLNPEDGTQLSRFCQNLMEQPFEFESTLENGKRILFKGRALGGNSLFILWAKEINDEITISRKVWQELKLFEHENKIFKNIMNGLPHPIWAKAKDGSIIYCNNSYARALNSTIDTILSNNRLLEELPPYRDITLKPEKENQKIKIHLLKIYDQQKVFALHEYLLNNQESVGYASDITDLVLSKEETKKSKVAQTEILNQIDQPIAIFGRDSKLNFYNKAYERLYNLNPAWLDTSPTLGEILEEQRVKRLLPECANFPAYKKQQIQNLISLTEPIEELQHLPNERTLHLIITPYPLGGCLFIWEDITENLVLEQRYNNLAHIQHETLSKIQEGVAICNDNGKITFTNQSFNELWNLEDEEYKKIKYLNNLLEITQANIKDPDKFTTFKQDLLATISRRQETTLKFTNHDNKAIKLHYYPLPGGSNLISCANESSNDITIYHDQKSESNQLLHKLRSSLTTITGFADILISEAKLEDIKIQKHILSILSFAQRSLTSINDVLDIESLKTNQLALSKKYFDLYQMLTVIIKKYSVFAIEKDMKIELDCPNDIGIIFADENRLKQAIGHLILNAINYTPTKGSITISVSRDPNHIQISIEDQGIGIPENVLNNLDNDEQKSNTGIYFAKSILQFHGGNLIINSKPNSGTKVVCDIPV